MTVARTSAVRSGGDGRRCLCPGSDLVEAGAAIDGSIVARRERDHRLAAASAADRRVELARTAVGSSPFGHGAAGRAALRIVEKTLGRKERLLPTRERELPGAIAAGEGAILKHDAGALLLGAVAPVCVAAPRAESVEPLAPTGGAHERVTSGSNPELMKGTITSTSRGSTHRISQERPAVTTTFERMRGNAPLRPDSTGAGGRRNGDSTPAGTGAGRSSSGRNA